jgi:DNA-binding transcriptional ArsR family regulator
VTHSDEGPEQAPPDPASAGDPLDAVRPVTDPKALRALAHPVRVALLEAVAVHGVLTATEGAEILGGTVANVAYHLRTLAKYGYLVEAEQRGGRERPWRLGAVGLRWDADDPDPAMALAGRALRDTMTERALGRLRRYREQPDRYPADVRAASGESQFIFFGTPAEAERLHQELLRVLMPYADRIADPALRPESSIPFEMLLLAYPFDNPGDNPAPEHTDPEG